MLSGKEQKVIKSLKVKKYRTRERRFLVEGTKNVLELLNSDFNIELLAGTKPFFEAHYRSVQSYRCEVIKPNLLTQISSFKANDSVLAVAKMLPDRTMEKKLKDSLFILDGIRDPGNLGTIIRTLDWFGFDRLVCSPDSAEFYSPKVISGTMGSFTRVRVVYKDLVTFLPKFHSVPIYCTDMRGEDINKAKLINPCIIVMGSESHGVSEPVAKLASKSLGIPGEGKYTNSLNVGVATGIIASHLRISM